MTELDDATYVPGNWVAVSARHGWLLVDLPPQDPTVRRCWKLLSESGSVDAVLDALAAPGIAAVPAFVLVNNRGSTTRVVVRGRAAATVHLEGDDVRETTAAPSVSWVDRIIEGKVDAVVLDAPGAAGTTVELPMGTGVTAATSLRVGRGVPSNAETAARVGSPVQPTPPVAPSSEQPGVPPLDLEPASAASDAVPDHVTVDAGAAPDATNTDTPQVEDEGDADYDDLLMATQRPHELPPVVDPTGQASSDGPLRDPTVGWETTATAFETGRPEPPGTGSTPEPTSAKPPSAGLIEAVPWLGGAQGSTAPDRNDETPPVEQSIEADTSLDRTVDRAATPAPSGPTVLAGYCEAGHLSPPHAERCRVCRAPMPPQAPFEIGCPPLGTLLLSTGDVINLDRGVLFGRSPSVSADAESRPHVVRLTSPEKDISRNHAEIVLDGWNVYVRDLGSTNGTTLTLPGRDAERLRDNELRLLEAGALISLADEVSVTFEVGG